MTVSSATTELSFDGFILRRGFWLYIWEITTPAGEGLYYVGRTGDSSSLKAQSPFNRLGQHLGFAKASNALRRQLQTANVNAEDCTFRFVAHGPILLEASDLGSHRERRDITAAMEKALADAMSIAGYRVLNDVHCKKVLNESQFQLVLDAFASRFPLLASNG